MYFGYGGIGKVTSQKHGTKELLLLIEDIKPKEKYL